MNELNFRKISEDELREILEKHEKWLNDDTNGEKASLLCADMRGVDMREANLRGVDMRGAFLQGADMRGADMLWVDMLGAFLQGADMRGADIDFSCWPLWCGSLDVTVDKRIAAQLAYHFCRLICDDEEVKSAQKLLAPLANQFHRVEECGRIEE